MKITIIQIGKTRAAAIAEMEEEYLKRLAPYARLQVITMKDGKGSPGEAKRQEAEHLLKKIPKNSFVIALDEHGKQMTSREFSQYMGKKRDSGASHLTFLIGGCYGLDESVLHKAELILSFSKFTFTHELIRPLLYEQLYRSFTLLQGKTYHY